MKTVAPDLPPSRLYGWLGDARTFLATDQHAWFEALQQHRHALLSGAAEPEQDRAWRDSYQVLHEQIALLVDRRPQAVSWHLLFEYELPREGGRRTDLLVLAGAAIICVEFKRVQVLKQEHIDQVTAYARDLQAYHGGCRGRQVIALLVPTSSDAPSSRTGTVTVVAPRNLARGLAYFAERATGEPIDVSAWLHADYDPLLTVVGAARRIFADEPLPDIRRAASAQIPQTVARLQAVVTRARTAQERHVCILTGVPGSGKTLVGLQLVHRQLGPDAQQRGLYLLRNAPLVRVLQHQLRNTVFVQNVYSFHRRYNDATGYLPGEHLLVYDEAQRALDAATVSRKRQHRVSEPQELVRLADRMRDWAVLVALVGEGQEIYLGEEGGLELWNEASKESPNPWYVHTTAWNSAPFTAAARLFTSDRLDLSTSLRSHLAGDIHRWVNQTLGGTFLAAKKTAATLQQQGFTMYVSQDWERIQAYVRARYAGQLEKRYRIVSSSKAKPTEGTTGRRSPTTGKFETVLQHLAQNDSFQARKTFDVVPWLTDPPDSPLSCCRLRDGAKEFDVQGLELDMPIISWGSDMIWQGNGWFSNWHNFEAKDYDQLRLNTYRVLLTRGRDGLTIWVPERLPAAFRALTYCGLQVLKEESPADSG